MMKCVRHVQKVAFVAMDLRDVKVLLDVVMDLRDVKVPDAVMDLRDVKGLVVVTVLREAAVVQKVAVQEGHRTQSDLLNMRCILMRTEMENSTRQK